MMRYLYIIYQYIIAIPILIVITLCTVLVTLLFAPWKNSVVPHWAQVFWARSVYKLLLISIHVDGTEHLTAGQSYVFICNHQSLLDVFAIYGWLPVVFKWMMKKELRKIPFIGLACRAAGHVFVDRSNPTAAMHSVDMLKSELQQGVSTVIFPEGTRTHTGQVGRFKRGAFVIAESLHLPIVPLSLTGCFEAMPRTQFFINPHAQVNLTIGEPVSLDTFDSSDEAIKILRQRVITGMEKNA